MHWSWALACFVNAQKEKDEIPATPDECNPYGDPMRWMEEETTREEVVARISVWRR